MFDIYENKSGNDQIASETKQVWEMDRIDCESGGIKLYLKGCDYPQKGWPTHEALFAVNAVKKIILVLVKRFSIFMNIESFNVICWGIISPYVLRFKYQQEFTKELDDFIYKFLMLYGVKDEIASKFSTIISHVFEYDWAYRMRLQDLFNETNSVKLYKYPRKEMRRLLELNRVRDFKEASDKFKMFARLVSWAFFIPKVKRCFREALKSVDFKKLQPDDGDKYWMLCRIDYNPFGKTEAERKKMLDEYNFVKGIDVTI